MEAETAAADAAAGARLSGTSRGSRRESRGALQDLRRPRMARGRLRRTMVPGCRRLETVHGVHHLATQVVPRQAIHHGVHLVVHLQAIRHGDRLLHGQKKEGQLVVLLRLGTGMGRRRVLGEVGGHRPSQTAHQMALHLESTIKIAEIAIQSMLLAHHQAVVEAVSHCPDQGLEAATASSPRYRRSSPLKRRTWQMQSLRSFVLGPQLMSLASTRT